MKFKGFRIVIGGIIISIVMSGLLTFSSSNAFLTQSNLWRDDFNSTELNQRWYWQNEDPDYWSLTDYPGYMLMRTKEGYTAMSLLQDVPPGDFEIETYLEFTPAENFQGAGLLAYLDSNNILALIRAYCDTPSCIGNGIYYDHVENGEMVGSNYGTSLTSLSVVWLKLIREGNIYTAYYSENGTDWVILGDHTPNFRPESFGLDVHNSGNGPEIPAKFDYFKMVDNSQFLYLPLIIK